MPLLDSGSSSPMLARRGSRKGSFPPSFGCPSSTATLEVPNAAALTKRRLSHVSEAVSRRLSTTIGWGKAVNTHEITEEAKSLCSQYIRSRLRRNGIFGRKLGLQRLRSVMNMTVNYGTCEVFNELNSVGKELERMHPKLYTSVCRQICMTITSEEVLHHVFTSIAAELFRTDVSWGKIVSLFAVCGGLAADCVRQGHVDYLLCLIESMGLFFEHNISTWIAHEGGWTTLLTCFKPQSPVWPSEKYFSLAALIATVLVLCSALWVTLR